MILFIYQIQIWSVKRLINASFSFGIIKGHKYKHKYILVPNLSYPIFSVFGFYSNKRKYARIMELKLGSGLYWLVIECA